MRAGPSNIYRRLLAGQVTPERYVAVLKRAVDMRIRADRHERRFARTLEARSGKPEPRRGFTAFERWMLACSAVWVGIAGGSAQAHGWLDWLPGWLLP